MNLVRGNDDGRARIVGAVVDDVEGHIHVGKSQRIVGLAGSQSSRTAHVGLHRIRETPDAVVIVIGASRADTGSRKIKGHVSAHRVKAVHIFTGGREQAKGVVVA